MQGRPYPTLPVLVCTAHTPHGKIRFRPSHTNFAEDKHKVLERFKRCKQPSIIEAKGNGFLYR